jgi:hypothetical protein
MLASIFLSVLHVYAYVLYWVHPFGRMALRGVWQLQKLVVNYCDWGGSSRGIRYDDIVWFLTR